MNRNKIAVVINAPKGVGKDVAAEYIDDTMLMADDFNQCYHLMFKEKLYRMTAEFYNVPYKELVEDATDRATKEVPMEKYYGRSPRQALIHISEDIAKPHFGMDFFGRAAVARIESIEKNARDADEKILYIFSDGGFSEEIAPIMKYVGIDNLMIIRVSRPGHQYDETDSRRYLVEEDFGEPVRFVDVENNGTLDDFLHEMYDVVTDFVYNQKGGL